VSGSVTRRFAAIGRCTVGGAALLTLAACASATPEIGSGRPVDRGLYLDVIRQLEANGRSRAALAYLDDYGNRWPETEETQLLRARILLSLDETERARSIFLSLADGRLQDEAMAGLGTVALRRGRLEEALAAFEIAVDLAPAEPRFLNNLGYALMLADRPEAALAVLSRAAELAPRNGHIRNNLAIAAHWSGERRLADAIVAGLPEPQARRDLRRLMERFYD